MGHACMCLILVLESAWNEKVSYKPEARDGFLEGRERERAGVPKPATLAPAVAIAVRFFSWLIAN